MHGNVNVKLALLMWKTYKMWKPYKVASSVIYLKFFER